jgi:uncharacterized phage-associated protein
MTTKTIQKLTTEDLILYILNRLEPEKSDRWYLNKIAFLVEFAYLYFNEKELSSARYAAIDHGPVIDTYKDILKGMEKKKQIRLDGYKIRLLDSKPVEVSKELSDFMNPLIRKYSQMTRGELKALTHATDSYQITTKNEKVMGNIIDKNLSSLETFFNEDEDEDELTAEDIDLPRINFDKLVKYEI